MLIAKVENGVVVDVQDYRTMFPMTVFPNSGPTNEWLATNSCMKVNLSKPYDLKTQVLYSVDPYIEGDWVYTIQVRNATAEELQQITRSKAMSVRAYRNQLLSATDWRFRSDLIPSQEWKNYCQLLRDVPLQTGFPWDVQWPSTPE